MVTKTYPLCTELSFHCHNRQLYLPILCSFLTAYIHIDLHISRDLFNVHWNYTLAKPTEMFWPHLKCLYLSLQKGERNKPPPPPPGLQHLYAFMLCIRDLYTHTHTHTHTHTYIIVYRSLFVLMWPGCWDDRLFYMLLIGS